jgi:hypothetical protein|eukprot:2054679-Prymnesium_polylepis.2
MSQSEEALTAAVGAVATETITPAPVENDEAAAALLIGATGQTGNTGNTGPMQTEDVADQAKKTKKRKRVAAPKSYSLRNRKNE